MRSRRCRRAGWGEPDNKGFYPINGFTMIGRTGRQSPTAIRCVVVSNKDADYEAGLPGPGKQQGRCRVIKQLAVDGVMAVSRFRDDGAFVEGYRRLPEAELAALAHFAHDRHKRIVQGNADQLSMFTGISG